MEPLLYKNVAAYKFANLAELDSRRTALRKQGKELGLRGTILLSPEGINLVVSGRNEAVDEFLGSLKQDPLLVDIETKESHSRGHSFNRFLVKLKREIIAFGVDGIEPANYTSKRITPRDLKKWFDEGKDFDLLDVRNNYEMEVGTFKGAKAIDLETFRKFPEAVDALPQEMQDRPVVTFCTGGIRCEKAAPLLEAKGFKNVYQLDGGILRYFEEIGAAHYDGDCFVFDNRVAVDPTLAPTSHSLCFSCQHVLLPEELGGPEYIPGERCKYCYKSPQVSGAAQLAARKETFLSVSSPLPGSLPYENQRPLRVPGRAEGQAAIEFMVEISSRTRAEWMKIFAAGNLLRREIALEPLDILRGGDRLLHRIPNYTEPTISTEVEWLYEDDSIFAIGKSAPLPMHPSGRFNKNSLLPLLSEIYTGETIRSAHRLDALTTGVVIFSRRLEVAAFLQEQFERRTVRKTYLARVVGRPKEDQFSCDAKISREPVKGIRHIDAEGLSAMTNFSVLSRSDDGTTLLEVSPLTGRTNQIRLHLWYLGFPITGDPTYLPNGELSDNNKQNSAGMALHAWKLEIVHPVSRRPIAFTAPPPNSWSIGVQ